ncbi:hypothetical protein BZG36_00492 [Bifiguratus adelaidae]|uniref:RRM domain-containing protein n=1 Tax=Bifiguratus adelaidae TaxID=1938954 RepID=A0A261Y7B9_9FUNG|nr:hypothetical protein BZG36_00492 [Bifiguratus adelaidae]
MSGMDIDRSLDDIIKDTRNTKNNSKGAASKKPSSNKPNKVKQTSVGPVRSKITKRLGKAPYARPTVTRTTNTTRITKKVDPASLIITKAVTQATTSKKVVGKPSGTSRISGGPGTGFFTSHKTTTPIKSTTNGALGRGLSTGRLGSNIAGRNVAAEPKKKPAAFNIKGEGGPTGIIIMNLDLGANADDVRTAFGEFGDITACDLFYDRNGRSTGTAEVQFVSKAAALAAIKKYDGAVADGRILHVQLKPSAALSSAVTQGRPTAWGDVSAR